MLNADELRQTTVTVVVTILLAIGLFWGETYRRQWKEFNAGEEYYKAQDFKRAITAYESAIHMYTPYSGMVKTSSERLQEIGESYETKGDFDMALIAFRSLRSSFYAVRSFYTPYQEVILLCEEKIASILKKQEAAQQASAASAAAPEETAPPPGETAPAVEE